MKLAIQLLIPTYNDLYVWTKVLDRQSHTSYEASASDWHNDSVNVRHLVDYLKAERSLTCQDVRVVVPIVYKEGCEQKYNNILALQSL